MEKNKEENLIMSVDFNNFLPCLTVEKVLYTVTLERGKLNTVGIVTVKY